jgi:hypothetical protein
MERHSARISFGEFRKTVIPFQLRQLLLKHFCFAAALSEAAAYRYSIRISFGLLWELPD